ncbi:MAG: YggS family pyridoxal phosphate-dependent enzyme [Saccharospirillaceae bacterium]|nr:YggS family pyridoxal phosphate-dependent enzyme [Saccharospirillaceae bacterium]MCD8532295.1 YggS family pyridoxal phosphate-dependent enzyme [Saccharospirillaceae bacterium]
MSTLELNYQNVLHRLQQACAQSNRPAQNVRLLAVSKTKPAAMVEAVYAMGQRSFGENYLQDGMDKITALAHLQDIEWHFIGPVQSNKTRPIAEHFQWVETLERDKIARRLSEQRSPQRPALNVLVQVNISAEEQKAGVLPDDAHALCALVSELPNLRLRGLMCIPEATDNEARLRTQFQAMQALFQQLAAEFPTMDTLSMGMSGDLELAVECGSTEIRIGTDIFGARDYPSPYPPNN